MMHILSVATGVRVCHWQVGYAVDVTRLPRIDHLTRLARSFDDGYRRMAFNAQNDE